MVNFQSSLVTSLVGVAGACALTKGWLDLKNPKVNQKLAKAEILAGSISLTFTALKTCLLINDYFNADREIAQKQIAEYVASIKQKDKVDYVMDKLYTGISVVGCFIISTRMPVIKNLYGVINNK